MNRSLSLLLAGALLAPAASAQPLNGSPAEGLYVGNQRPAVRVSTAALAQGYEDGDTTLTQLTFPVTVFVPLRPDLGLSVRLAASSVEGDGLAGVFGPTDAQVAASYYRPVGTGSVVASVAVNVPLGEAALSQGERSTAFLLGQSFYDFRLPSLAQGFNVAPGLTWAMPVGERLAVGLGAAYQVRGPFEPRRFSEDRYDPGDELLVTAGVDYRLGDASALALDASYIHYGEDTWEGLRYTTGDAVAVTAQWNGTVVGRGVRLLGRVRHKADTTIPPEASALLGLDATVPTQARMLGEILFPVGPRLALGAFVQGRHYSESEVFAARTLLDVGVAPEYQVGQGLSITGRLGATLGSFQGAQVGLGAAWSL